MAPHFGDQVTTRLRDLMDHASPVARTGRTARSAFVVCLLLATVLAGTAAAVPAPVATPVGTGHHSLVSNPTNCSSGTLIGPTSTGSLVFAACLQAFSTATTYNITVFANVSGGIPPYQYTLNWGDLTRWNATSNLSSTGPRTHLYVASGNYTLTASVIDASNVSAALTSSFLVNISTPRPAVTLTVTNSTIVNGTPTTQIAWSLSGGVPPYALYISFGDGSSFGGPNSTSTVTGVVDHFYPSGNGSTTYWGYAIVYDSTGATGSASFSTTPNYSGGSGNGSSTFMVSWTNRTSFHAVGMAGSFVLTLDGNLTLNGTSNTSWERLDVVASWTGGVSPYTVRLFFGDGTWANLTSSGMHWVKVYSTPAAYDLTVYAADSSNLSVNGTIYLPNLGSGGGGSTWTVTWYSSTFFLASGADNGFSLLANGTVQPYGSGESLDVWLSPANGTTPLTVRVDYGDGASGVYFLNPNMTVFPLSHVYSAASAYTLFLGVTDVANRTVSGTVPIPNVANSSGSSPPGPYPHPVSVVVSASPVSGLAPLVVTLSALITQGAPPFDVAWSLPGAIGSGNATGLEVTADYPTTGWYPATAFVYNTTSSWGTVIVGEGSVWVEVTGNLSSGSGNGGLGGNGNEGNTHSGGSLASNSPWTVSSPAFTWLLTAIGVGGAVGGLAGFVLGRRPPRESAAVRIAPTGGHDRDLANPDRKKGGSS